MNDVLLELLLLKNIAQMKNKLLIVANSTGINSNQTIKYSQELDNLLNLHMKHFSHKEKNVLISASTNIGN
ncbi:aspartyl-phosphate phosphatase Spo0E family protein [Neobacillus drentensis]|uniref:aspartyl-phosphate phosphatase Spo0E family protein n=1 Tax=Neobacillus drentensis TaxID=220684 RepID=UPI002FFD8127